MRCVVEFFSRDFRKVGIGIAAFLFACAAAGGAEAREARVVIDFFYSDAREFCEGLAAVKSGDSWGYIDSTNRIAVPFSHKIPEAGAFSAGLAFVGNHFIDREGNPAFEGQIFEQGSSFSENLAAVQSNGQWGYIDLEGKFSILPMYEAAGPFSGGRAPVKKDGLWGYIDLQGRMLISPRFTRADVFGGGEKNLAAVEYDGGVGYIDRSGRFVIPPVYEEGGAFQNSLAPVKGAPAYDVAAFAPRTAGEWGYIGATGREMIPRRFFSAGEFKDGLAPVATDARWGYIDVKGRLALDAFYDNARPFSEGLAAVERDGKWGYIRVR